MWRPIEIQGSSRGARRPPAGGDSMSLFPHRELRYYFFGLRAGMANLFVNGLRLGAKKTAGKILQPVNSYTRFPEYYWFDRAITAHLAATPPASRAAVLDVGSPKLLGLYLGVKTTAEITLTDISELNIDEYTVMWKALQKRAKGKADFSLQDARQLRFADSSFDVVYSMSVLEHIEGQGGDSAALSELLRVLKPGGLLVLSVPFGATYIEQKRVGFSGAARKTGDQKAYFFQRVYDRPSFEQRIVGRLAGVQDVKITTVQRTLPWISRAFGALGENARGLLGAFNPLLSAIGNRSVEGVQPFATNYREFHTAKDVYGDLVLTARKR
jgi:ubiquinone/menaquinone biosynthesis C-methylase UbiE